MTDSSASLISLLESLGVTHVVTLPDNTSAVLLEELAARGAKAGSEKGQEGRLPVDVKGRPPVGAGQPGSIRVITATREGEAVALASGLWLGGAAPVVLIQNTGLLESGDGLRGTASRMGAPLLLLVTCRGYPKVRAGGFDPATAVVDRDALVRNDLDSVALMTEQTLEAWGIPFFHMRDPGDLSPIRQAWSQAQWEERPVAVLIDTSLA
jgi:sulfopyruvate decarboxylase subunit alpha